MAGKVSQFAAAPRATVFAVLRFGRFPRARPTPPAAIVLGLIVAGCTSIAPPPPPPPSPPSEPPATSAPAAPASPVASVREEPAVCAPDAELNAELARLRRELAARDAELRELRAQQRDQIRSIEEIARSAERTKAKLRRRATRADTATLLADVEVLMLQERAAGGRPGDALLASAKELLESASAAFARGDYATAFDRADQAWHTVTAASEERTRAAAAVRARGEVPIDPPLPTSVITDTPLRQQPSRKAPVVATVKEASPVVASARKQDWTRVLTADGRSGWIYGPHLAPR